MRKSKYAEILRQGIKLGKYPGKQKEAREWYRKTARAVSVGNVKHLMDPDFKRKEVFPGFLYFYQYDPKYKDILPYYDVCPLVFPFRKVPGGFLGLNMHYLPPAARAALMDKLYELASNDRFNDNTKLQMNYAVLTQVANLRMFKPCVKHYLINHLKTRLYKIPAEYWDIALFLPTESFQKAKKEYVWQQAM